MENLDNRYGDKEVDDLDVVESSQLFEVLLNTREQGQMMEFLIENQIKVKDEMIDKLHKELEHYRNGAADKFVEQLMKAVIKVRKDMSKIIYSDRWNGMLLDDLKREYMYTFEDLTDLLEQQNIDAYKSSEGTIFDGMLHQPKIEITQDESLDKKIKKSISEGYKRGDKVLIPERVIVYQCKS